MRLVLALAAALAVAAPAQAIEIDRMAGVRSFALALGDGAAAKADGFDLVVVDGSTPARRVKQLRADGAMVFGYLSVGTIESYRSWFKAAKPYRMELWDDWGEWYARVSAPGFRRLIVRRVAPAILDRGFDGLFLDNVDMIETHPAQAAGMRKLVRALWRGPGVLMAQNGDSIIEPFLRYLDAWNREDVTSTYDFDAERYRRVPAEDHADALATLERLSKRLKLVTATDYVAAGDTVGAAAARDAACGAGALSFVSDIELRRIPPPAECP